LSCKDRRGHYFETNIVSVSLSVSVCVSVCVCLCLCLCVSLSLSLSQDGRHTEGAHQPGEGGLPGCPEERDPLQLRHRVPGPAEAGLQVGHLTTTSGHVYSIDLILNKTAFRSVAKHCTVYVFSHAGWKTSAVPCPAARGQTTPWPCSRSASRSGTTWTWP